MGFRSGDAAFLGVAAVLPKVTAMGGCCPCARGGGGDHAGARTPHHIRCGMVASVPPILGAPSP